MRFGNNVSFFGIGVTPLALQSPFDGADFASQTFVMYGDRGAGNGVLLTLSFKDTWYEQKQQQQRRKQ